MNHDPVDSDPHELRLLSQVRPADWTNPRPQARYDLVVIGGGTAGLVTAVGAAGLGAKVALVEKNRLGGDCLNFGCVPSKALIRAARAAEEARRGPAFGIHVEVVRVDFAAVMERVRRVRADISPNDSAARLRAAGVDVFLGRAELSGPTQIEVAGQRLRSRKTVIATGASPAPHRVEGLKAGDFHTNETIFNLTVAPQNLAVIGGGPIGCELAQAFQRLGAAVTLLHNKSELLDKEDSDAGRVVREELTRDGVRVVTQCGGLRIENIGEGRRIAWSGGTAFAGTILAAAGRSPNVEGLGLEKTGVDFDDHGVKVDDFLRTSHPDVYAAGDVCLDWKFTHAADATARIVIQNALFGGRKRLSGLVIPWCTYTDPEVAHVGRSERDLVQSGAPHRVFKQELSHVDRAILDGSTEGFVKICTEEKSGRILGATIVARHAGEMIGQVTLAMQKGHGLGTLAGVILPYPVQAMGIKQAGDAFQRTRLSKPVAWLLKKWLDLNRPG